MKKSTHAAAFIFLLASLISYTLSAQDSIKVVHTTIQQSCVNGNFISYRCFGGTPPYTVHLYRYGIFYEDVISNGMGLASFFNLPNGLYSASAIINSDSVISESTPLVSPVTNSGISNLTDHSVTLTWIKLACVKYYIVKMRLDGTTKWYKRNTDGNVDFMQVNHLQPSTLYDYHITSADSANGETALDNSIGYEGFYTLAAANNALQFSPNPAYNSINVKIPLNGVLQIANLSGNILINKKVIAGVAAVNISALLPGTYTMRLITEQNITETKLVKR